MKDLLKTEKIREAGLYFSENELRKQLRDTTDARNMIEKMGISEEDMHRYGFEELTPENGFSIDNPCFFEYNQKIPGKTGKRKEVQHVY